MSLKQRLARLEQRLREWRREPWFAMSDEEFAEAYRRTFHNDRALMQRVLERVCQQEGESTDWVAEAVELIFAIGQEEKAHA